MRGLGFNDSKLAFKVCDLELKESDILKALLVLNLTLGKGALEDLDLFIEEGQLVVSSDELSSKDVSLVDDVLVVLLELLMLLMCLLNYVCELLHLILMLCDQLLCLCVLILLSL